MSTSRENLLKYNFVCEYYCSSLVDSFEKLLCLQTLEDVRFNDLNVLEESCCDGLYFELCAVLLD